MTARAVVDVLCGLLGVLAPVCLWLALRIGWPRLLLAWVVAAALTCWADRRIRLGGQP